MVPCGGQFQPLSGDDAKQIYAATLCILESAGVAVHSPQALTLLEQAGGQGRALPAVRLVAQELGLSLIL